MIGGTMQLLICSDDSITQ